MIAVAESTSAEVSKSRRRSVSRSPRVQAEKSVKVGLYISQESARKLGITATMEGKDRSAIVDELIRQHLRKYVVSVRSSRSEELANVPEEVSAA